MFIGMGALILLRSAGHSAPELTVAFVLGRCGRMAALWSSRCAGRPCLHLADTSGRECGACGAFQAQGKRTAGFDLNNAASTAGSWPITNCRFWRDRSTATRQKPTQIRLQRLIILASEMLACLGKRCGTGDRGFPGAWIAFSECGAMEEFCRGAANTEIIGRGPAYGAAIMGAFTIREMSGHRAAPHTGAGFKHGPNLDVDASHVAVIFALGRTAGLGVKLRTECNQRGGKVILVSSEDHKGSDQLLR